MIILNKQKFGKIRQIQNFDNFIDIIVKVGNIEGIFAKYLGQDK